jgi:phosphate starvation-inducible PhoH-like protein
VRAHDITFSIGPAGTGKTYLAVAMAIDYLKREKVKRIILTRPAVEAGEELGFLPGDIQAKVSPYLRPLYDAIYDMIPVSEFEKLIEHGRIEMAPLAFMRGRTLNNCFVILDEAQNTTSEQMKMFLTRIGFNSKAVITGDITQIDLPPERPSGLIESKNILQDIDGIKFVFFSKRDVVRHKLVQKIIQAYEELEASKNNKNP